MQDRKHALLGAAGTSTDAYVKACWKNRVERIDVGVCTPENPSAKNSVVVQWRDGVPNPEEAIAILRNTLGDNARYRLQAIKGSERLPEHFVTLGNPPGKSASAAATFEGVRLRQIDASQRGGGQQQEADESVDDILPNLTKQRARAIKFKAAEAEVAKAEAEAAEATARAESARARSGAQPLSETISVVKDLLEVTRPQERAAGVDPTMTMMFELLQRQADAQRREAEFWREKFLAKPEPPKEANQILDADGNVVTTGANEKLLDQIAEKVKDSLDIESWMDDKPKTTFDKALHALVTVSSQWAPVILKKMMGGEGPGPVSVPYQLEGVNQQQQQGEEEEEDSMPKHQQQQQPPPPPPPDPKLVKLIELTMAAMDRGDWKSVCMVISGLPAPSGEGSMYDSLAEYVDADPQIVTALFSIQVPQLEGREHQIKGLLDFIRLREEAADAADEEDDSPTAPKGKK